MSEAIGLSRALAEAVSRVAGSVVRLSARRGASSSAVAWSADGIVVTASHAVEQEDAIEVGLPDGTTAEARLVGRDAATDVAVLKVDVRGLQPASWIEPEGLAVGHLVLAVSRPGRSARASLGIVAALADEWRTPAGGRLSHYLQTDIALQPGFSGSLLVDVSGRAIGINTSGLVRAVALALPCPSLRRIVGALLAHGLVRRGYLGLGTYPVQIPAALAESVGQRSGLLIVSVEPGSPADHAGLGLGDTLLTLDGNAIAGAADLLPMLEEDRIGTSAIARIVRAGESREVTLTIGVKEVKTG